MFVYLLGGYNEQFVKSLYIFFIFSWGG